MNKNVACYVRVSTENQIENYSIEEQTDRLIAYCKAKDYINYKFYTDGGYSGGNIERPALQNMLHDIKNGLISMVIVYKLDRLSRSQKDTLTLIEDMFLTNNVDFVSVNENFDTTTAFGKAMIGILSVFAQLEKDQITERFTMGRIGRAKAGFFHGGSYIPTGYDYKDGELVINEYEAMQVRMVYDMFLKGKSIHGIWRHMQDNYTTKYGTWNSDTLVRNVLKNSVYIGKIKFKNEEFDGKHEKIIDNDTFNNVQKLLKASTRNNYKTSYQKTPFRASCLLTGKIYCKQCGARFCGEHGNYSCYSRNKTDKKKIKDPNCKNKKWNIKELDDKIMKFIENIDFDNIETESRTVENNDIIVKRILEIDKQIERMVDLYQIGTISIQEIKERTDKLMNEKSNLQNVLATSKENESKTIDEVKNAQIKLLSLKETDSLEEKRLLLSYIIERIEIDNDNVDIYVTV